MLAAITVKGLKHCIKWQGLVDQQPCPVPEPCLSTFSSPYLTLNVVRMIEARVCQTQLLSLTVASTGTVFTLLEREQNLHLYEYISSCILGIGLFFTEHLKKHGPSFRGGNVYELLKKITYYHMSRAVPIKN